MTPGRLLLLLPAGAALVGGLWAGLVRVGALDVGVHLASLHGPLMICGFLGTLISLERAVAVDSGPAYAVPALAAIGGIGLLAGLPWTFSALAALLAGVGLVGVFALLARREPTLHVAVMALGAVAWILGTLAWLRGAPMATATAWWAGFLILTIVAERLELNRVRRLPPWASGLLVTLVAILLVALPLAEARPDLGVPLMGAALLGMAAWLLAFDVARVTVRGRGLSRFVAVCLLSGYAWLGVGGALLLTGGPTFTGPLYDAQLHAIFVGFVLSMIFGHAPVVLPAVLQVALRYRPVSYLPLALLHATLLVRVAGDLAGVAGPRQWGAVGGVAAVALFVVLSVASALAPELRGAAAHRVPCPTAPWETR